MPLTSDLHRVVGVAYRIRLDLHRLDVIIDTAGPVEVGPVEVGPVEVGPVEAGPVEAGPSLIDVNASSVHSISASNWIEPDQRLKTWNFIVDTFLLLANHPVTRPRKAALREG